MPRTEHIHVRLSVKDREAVDRLVQIEDSNRSHWVRTAIREKLRRELQKRQHQAKAARDARLKASSSCERQGS